MFVQKYLKKKLWLFGTTLLIIGICILASYNVKNKNNVDNTDLIMNNGNLKIVLVDGKNGVKNSLYPLSYEQGILLSPSNVVKIVNKSHLSTKFSIYLKENDVDNNSIDANKVYFSINNENPKILGSVVNNEIYSGSIEKRSETILDIKVWAGEELVNSSDAGKLLSYKIEVK